MVEDIIIYQGNTEVSTVCKTLFIGPDVKHYNDSLRLIDIMLDHETLHIVLDRIGERKASNSLDNGMVTLIIEDLRVGLESFMEELTKNIT